MRGFEHIERQALRRLQILDEANTTEELMSFPSNHLEALGGDKRGKYSIRVNKQYRICFSFHDGNAYDVAITDYH